MARHAAPHVLGSVLAGVALAACNALVESPDAFSLRPPAAGCDGGDCADGGPLPEDEAGSAKRGPDPDAPWPMLGANAAHTSRVAVTGTDFASPTNLWEAKFGTTSAGPSVDGDGTAYFTTSTGALYAVRRDGTNWSQPLGGKTRCTPALAADGSVYATAEGVGLVAYSRDGSTKRWTVPVGGGSHPVIGKNGTIYVVDGDGVHAVSPAGAKLWTYPIGASAGTRDEAVAIDESGIIYAVREGTHAIDPNGKRVWHEPAYGDVLSPPPVVADKRIFVGSADRFVALSTDDRAKLWDNGGRLRASPAVAKSGVTFVSEGTLLLASVDSGDYLPPSPTIAITRAFTPAIDGRDHVYVASADGLDFPVALRFKGTVEQEGQWTLGEEPVGFALGKDGALYIATTTRVMALPR